MLYALVALVLLAALLLFAVSRRPDAVHYERSLAIAAPPERILPHINDFHNWIGWSPYEKVDPGMKRTHGGGPEGPGATYAWSGNKKAGEGSMRILESSTRAVRIDLHFVRPFKSDRIARFDLVPQSGGTTVTWSLDGPNPFMSKVMGLFMDFDRMVGKDFEAGLRDLGNLVTR